MATITIRDVPDDVRNELAARAERAGQSLQAYLRRELIALAKKPALPDLVAEIRRWKAAAATTLPADKILAHRDADSRQQPWST
jgi:plasmid stability protein